MKTYGYNRTVHVTANHPLWQGAESWAQAGIGLDYTCVANLIALNGKTAIDLADHTNNFLTSIVDGVEYLYPRPSQAKTDKGTNKVFKSSMRRRIELGRNLGLIVGYYAAEGSIGADGRLVQFSLDGHHDIPLVAMVNELSTAMEAVFGKCPSVYPNGNVSQMGFSSRLIAGLMSSICPGLASSKRVDPEILFSNPEFMQGFIRGYWHGDGCVNDKPQAIAGSTSRDLAVQVRLVLSYFGFPSTLRDVSPARVAMVLGRMCSCNAVTSVEIKGDNCREFATWLDGTTLDLRTHRCRNGYITNDNIKSTHLIRSQNTYHYTGKVYNLEVAEDHSYSLPGMTVHNCYFPPDSEGFFRRSVIDNARNQAEFGIVLKPRKGCLYAMGVDPARTSDNFSIAIFEIDPDAAVIRLVRVASWNKKDFPLCHRLTRQLIKDYEVEYFEMDAGGGGTTIRDLLASEENCPDGQKLILEQDFDEHKLKTGTRILGPLIQFSCYQWVHDANHNLLSGLQHGKLKIAAKSPMPIAPWNIWSAELEEAEEEMERALSEWASVVTTPLGSRLHWDTPTKTMRKDRYSAILIGFNAALRVLGENNKPTKLAAGFWMPAYGHMGR